MEIVKVVTYSQNYLCLFNNFYTFFESIISTISSLDCQQIILNYQLWYNFHQQILSWNLNVHYIYLIQNSIIELLFY
jgi:hypothetical protein